MDFNSEINQKIKKYPIDPNSFIGGWYIPHYVCDDLLTYMDQNKNNFVEGRTSKGINPVPKVNKEVKDSKDLSISPSNSEKPFYNYRIFLQTCLNEYIKSYHHVDKNVPFDIMETYNLQKYPVGGGFKEWHFENSYTTDSYRRILVFMTYLNDVPDGGTSFDNQKIETRAEKGLTLIWPSNWTHTHKGIISHTSEKQIVTGWYHSKALYPEMKTNV